MYRGSPVGVVHSSSGRWAVTPAEDPADLYRGYYPAMAAAAPGTRPPRRPQAKLAAPRVAADADDQQYASDLELAVAPPPQPARRPAAKPQATVALPSPQAGDEQLEAIYTKLLQDDIPAKMTGVPKHVLKVREVTDLLLFVAVAAAGIMLFDVTTKFFFSIARKKCP